MTVIYRYQSRRRTAANWTSGNEVLYDGEIGYETDTGKFKIGDGVTAWNSIADYFEAGAGGGGGITALTGDVTASGTGSVAATLATAQPSAHTWAATQTLTVAPIFTDASGTRTALGLGTLATQSGTFSGTSSGTNTGDQTNISGNAATVTTNANLTGHVTSVGNAAVLGSFTVAQLNTALSDANVATGGGTATGTNTGDQDLSSYATTSAVAAGYQPLNSNLTAFAGLGTSLQQWRTNAGGTAGEWFTASSGGADITVANTWTAAQTFSLEDAGTNTVLYPVKFRRTSSGTPANGIGVGCQFEVETTAGNNEIGATLEAVTADVTSTSEDFALVAKTMVAGSTTLVEGGRWVGAQYRAPSGSLAAPSFSFASGTGYGLWLDSGVILVATAGGVYNIGFGTSSMQVRLPMAHNSSNAANNRVYGHTKYVVASTAGSGAPKMLAIDDSSCVWTNEGASAKAYFTLPTAAINLIQDFIVQDADGIRIVANTGDTIRVIDKVTAAAGYIESTTIGSTVRLIAINATEWVAFVVHGVWTDGTFTFDDTSLTTP